MKILSDLPLKPYTTFKIGGPARYFAEIRSSSDLDQALAFAVSKRVELFVLGGGSNVLISDAGLDALVLHPTGAGIEAVEEGASQIAAWAQAAEPWDNLVAYCVERGWWGVENLSHIPGQTGAALVQNIGAYGQQISDVLVSAEAAEIPSGTTQLLLPADCGFAYRSSIFNSSHKGRYLILSVTLRLSRPPRPNLSYPDVHKWFEERGVSQPSLEEIRTAIISIRDLKFPYPQEEKGGNAGSFFKNLVLNQIEYDALVRRFQERFSLQVLHRLQTFRQRASSPDAVRIPSAFLIEACGLKARRMGRALVNEKQPLVLLNDGGATARDVLRLAGHIRRVVFAQTGLEIPIEPELAGFSPTELTEYLDCRP